ncbi:MAG: hypothetical protein K2Q23_11900 [Bryobacteraceae bacterium]|nr:hypothetical protein [Bryobacteraceae bacterium]
MSTLSKRISYAVSLVAASALAFLGASWVASRYGAVRAAVDRPSFVPHTLETQTFAPDEHGQVRMTERRLTAMKSDGTEVWIGTIQARTGTGSMRRLIRANGFATTAVEAIGGKISQYLPAATRSGRATKATVAGPECRFSYEKSGGERTILGVRASVSEFQPSHDTRQAVMRALDYGCVVLGARHERLTDGKWTLNVELVPVLFKGGEPATDLFDEAFYEKLKEMPPSEAQRRLYSILNITEAQCPTCFNLQDLSRLDAEYFQRQSPPKE